MITYTDIEFMQSELNSLRDLLEDILRVASSGDWKDHYVEEMSNFYEINEKLKELGYEGTEEKKT